MLVTARWAARANSSVPNALPRLRARRATPQGKAVAAAAMAAAAKRESPLRPTVDLSITEQLLHSERASGDDAGDPFELLARCVEVRGVASPARDVAPGGAQAETAETAREVEPDVAAQKTKGPKHRLAPGIDAAVIVAGLQRVVKSEVLQSGGGGADPALNATRAQTVAHAGFAVVPHLRALSHREYATCMQCLAKLRRVLAEKLVRKVATAGAAEIRKRQQHLGVEDVNMLAWAFAAFAQVHDVDLVAVDMLAGRARALLPTSQPREVASVLHSFAKARLDTNCCHTLLAAVESEIVMSARARAVRPSREPDAYTAGRHHQNRLHPGSFGTQAVANMLWAYATLRYDGDAIFTTFAEALVGVGGEGASASGPRGARRARDGSPPPLAPPAHAPSPTFRVAFRPLELTMLFWSYTTVRLTHGSLAHAVAHALTTGVDSASPTAVGMQVGDQVTMLWAFGVVAAKHRRTGRDCGSSGDAAPGAVPHAAATLAHSLSQRRGFWEECAVREVARGVWGAVCALRPSVTAPARPGEGERNPARAWEAFGDGHGDDGDAAHDAALFALLDHICDGGLRLRDRRCFLPRDVAVITWGYVVVDHPAARDVCEMFDVSLADSVVVGDGGTACSPRDLSLVMWAYAATNARSPRIADAVTAVAAAQWASPAWKKRDPDAACVARIAAGAATTGHHCASFPAALQAYVEDFGGLGEAESAREDSRAPTHYEVLRWARAQMQPQVAAAGADVPPRSIAAVLQHVAPAVVAPP